MLSDVYFFQGNPSRSLEILFKGIGADFLYIDNFNKAARFARLMEYDNLSSLLAMVGMIFNDQPIGDMPDHIDEISIPYKNVLFGAIGELIAFLIKMPTMEKLNKSERILVKKSLSKVTPDQIQNLKEFYNILEKL